VRQIEQYDDRNMNIPPVVRLKRLKVSNGFSDFGAISLANVITSREAGRLRFTVSKNLGAGSVACCVSLEIQSGKDN
jgi:hypothetical protein